MKNIMIILLLATMTVMAYAQTATEQIHISVAMPQQSTLDDNTKTILKNKLLAIASAEGVAATECGALAMVPETTVTNENTVEGGMRNIHTVELQLTVTVRNIITGTVFNTIQIDCKGEGYSKDEACRTAISRIETAKYTKTIGIAKDKINAYYQANTAAIIAKANTLAKQQQYDEAMALLASYPESLSGYTQVSAAITAIFRKSQTLYCTQLMQAARSAYAQRDFSTATSILAMVDVSSSCATEAGSLQAAIKHDTDAVYNNKIAIERERLQAKERLATATIQAARDVAVAYCKRQKEYVFFW